MYQLGYRWNDRHEDLYKVDLTEGFGQQLNLLVDLWKETQRDCCT